MLESLSLVFWISNENDMWLLLITSSKYRCRCLLLGGQAALELLSLVLYVFPGQDLTAL